VHDRQPHAAALADLLGRIEGIEHALENRRGDARARIADAKLDELAGHALAARGAYRAAVLVEPQTDADGSKTVPATKALVPRKPFDMTVNDRRFLRSLRIAAEETKVEETN